MSDSTPHGAGGSCRRPNTDRALRVRATTRPSVSSRHDGSAHQVETIRFVAGGVGMGVMLDFETCAVRDVSSVAGLVRVVLGRVPANAPPAAPGRRAAMLLDKAGPGLVADDIAEAPCITFVDATATRSPSQGFPFSPNRSETHTRSCRDAGDWGTGNAVNGRALPRQIGYKRLTCDDGGPDVRRRQRSRYQKSSPALGAPPRSHASDRESGLSRPTS